jgi:hypothetical protein
MDWFGKISPNVEQCKRSCQYLRNVQIKLSFQKKPYQTNLIIEGDNYHALSVLNYTHQGKG